MFCQPANYRALLVGAVCTRYSMLSCKSYIAHILTQLTRLSLLGPELGSGVGDPMHKEKCQFSFTEHRKKKSKEHSLDTQNLSPSDDFDPLLAAHTVGDRSGVLARVHEQKLELGEVVNEELLVAGREEVTGLLVGTVTDLGHGNLALEPSSNL